MNFDAFCMFKNYVAILLFEKRANINKDNNGQMVCAVGWKATQGYDITENLRVYGELGTTMIHNNICNISVNYD